MKKKKKSIPALMDVARYAGVGAATVSRVINGGQNVSAKTMAAVTKAIEELGYHPSHAARSLRAARSKTIGLIVPSVADPFFSSAANTIQQVAREHETLVLLAASENDPAREREQVTSLIQRRIDGLIIAPSDAADSDLLQHAGFPTICFDRPIKGSDLPTVLADSYRGAKIATEHLIRNGYKNILCVGGYAKLFTSQRRFRGHKDAVTRAGLPYLAELEVEDYASARAALVRHLSGPKAVDAIFSTKNTTTLDLYKICRELGLQIPKSIALLGFDDFDLADALDPPLSVVRQPVQQMASRAAEMLFDAMESGHQTKRPVTMDVDLVVRGSSTRHGK